MYICNYVRTFIFILLCNCTQKVCICVCVQYRILIHNVYRHYPHYTHFFLRIIDRVKCTMSKSSGVELNILANAWRAKNVIELRFTHA